MSGNGKRIHVPGQIAGNSITAMFARMEKGFAQSGTLGGVVALAVVAKPDGNISIQTDGLDIVETMLLLAQAQQVLVANMLQQRARVAEMKAVAQKAAGPKIVG